MNSLLWQRRFQNSVSTVWLLVISQMLVYNKKEQVGQKEIQQYSLRGEKTQKKIECWNRVLKDMRTLRRGLI